MLRWSSGLHGPEELGSCDNYSQLQLVAVRYFLHLQISEVTLLCNVKSHTYIFLPRLSFTYIRYLAVLE